MDYRKKINSQHEIVHPIIIWIIASILFHLLLTLGIITLKMNSLPLMHPAKNMQDHAILMMDEPKKQMPIATSAQPPIAAKEAKKQKTDGPKPSDYTMIPGRQGINQQNLDDPKNLQNLPKPQDQILEKKAKVPELKKPEEAQPEQIEKEEPAQEQALPSKIQESLPVNAQSLSKQTTSATKFTDQTLKKTSAKPTQKEIPKGKRSRQPTSEQNPYEFVPQPNRVISFKDLNLGFDNNYATVGNNANLIQQGITIAAPDEVSLKHLTYYNQCAGMMKAAFATHPQTRLRQNATGKRFRFDITVDRQGNLINLRVIHGSGDMILDRIIQESVESVKMFPRVPSFIPDSPFIMRWTFLH